MVTFRGVQLSGTWGCLDIVKGFHEPADARGVDRVAPGQPGRYAGNREADLRKILIEGFIRGLGSTAAERRIAWHEATMAIMDIMDPSLDPGELVVTDEYGLEGTWTINARCSDSMGSEIERKVDGPWQEWSFRLESVDPDWTPASS